MAVGTRKSSKDTRKHLAPAPRKKPASHTTKTVAFQTATPLFLSNVEHEPESPIGTFAATARNSRLQKLEKTVKQNVRPVATKRQRLQRVQFQPAAQSSTHVDDSSGSTVDISMFATAPSASKPPIPRILVDHTFDTAEEPGLLEILSQTAWNRSHSIPILPQPKLHTLHVDYPPDCYSLPSAQTIAASVAFARPERWTNVSLDAQRLSWAAPSSKHLVQFALQPPSAVGIYLDLGLRRCSSTPIAEFTHNIPATALVIEDSAPFLHRPSYAGYSKTRRPETYDFKHICAAHTHIATLPGGVKQVVKLIIPFKGTPFLSPNSVSSAEFVSETSRAPTADTGSELARFVWMQSTAHAFILALEEILQLAEDQLRFSPILHYTTSETTVLSSDECAYVTLYAHFDQIRQVRALLSTINVASSPSLRSQGSVTPFASTHISLLVLSASGHPLCLV